jgi:hypothetical protein
VQPAFHAFELAYGSWFLHSPLYKTVVNEMVKNCCRKYSQEIVTCYSGRPVWQTKLNVNKGTNAIELIVPNHLQSGNYILMISSKEGVINKMIQKQ